MDNNGRGGDYSPVHCGEVRMTQDEEFLFLLRQLVEGVQSIACSIEDLEKTIEDVQEAIKDAREA